MTNRSFGSLCVMATMLALASLAAAPASGQSQGSPSERADWTPPLTPWGAPDLRGVWDYRTMTPLERPRELAGRTVLTDAEAAAYERRQNELRADYDRSPSVHAKWWLDYGTELTQDNRTSLIVDPADGRLPPRTPEAGARAALRGEVRQRAAAAQDRSLTERCLTWGVPRLPGAYNNNYQILQTPTYVAIVTEMIHATRVIPLDGRPHLSDDIRQWHGDSRGRWEGNTLIIETTNFSPKGSFRGSTQDLNLVERFTRVGPGTIHYGFTVDDRATWDAAWTAMVPLTKTEQALYEYACHEGNHGLRNILHNARVAEGREGPATRSK